MLIAVHRCVAYVHSHVLVLVVCWGVGVGSGSGVRGGGSGEASQTPDHTYRSAPGYNPFTTCVV